MSHIVGSKKRSIFRTRAFSSFSKSGWSSLRRLSIYSILSSLPKLTLEVIVTMNAKDEMIRLEPGEI